MKAVHLSVVAMIAAASGIGTAIATKNSEALPQPISWGNSSQGMPVLSDVRMPVRTLR